MHQYWHQRCGYIDILAPSCCTGTASCLPATLPAIGAAAQLTFAALLASSALSMHLPLHSTPGARQHLEKGHSAYMLKQVAKHRTVAQRGGNPARTSDVQAFIAVKFVDKGHMDFQPSPNSNSGPGHDTSWIQVCGRVVVVVHMLAVGWVYGWVLRCALLGSVAGIRTWLQLHSCGVHHPEWRRYTATASCGS
jgi:hypothetical protein